MADELIILKDLRSIPDKYFEYTQALREFKIPIVIDNGSFACKAGWATSTKPELVFKNLLARPRKERGKKDGETLIGNDIPNLEAVRFQLKSQFDRNVVTQFNVQEQIFDYTFSHLGIDTERSIKHPIIITEPVANPNHSRLLMSELLFECYHVPGICYGVDGLFSFQKNSQHKNTGLIISCGYYTTHIIPIINGSPNLINCRRIDVGGYHIISYLHKLLQLKYPAHYNAITLSRAEELLYEHGFIANNYFDALNLWSDADYYDQNVKKIQLPYSMAIILTPDQQRDKRREMAKKLVEMNARKRDEKLAEDEEQLHQLFMIKEMIDDGEPIEEVREVLRSHGLKNDKDLKKMINDLQTRIDRTKSKIAASNAPHVDEQVTEEPKLRLFKNIIQLPKDEPVMKTWLKDIYKKRQDIIDRKAVRKQRRQDMAKRGTAASLERMRIISQLARKDKRDDDFGSRDEDWDVYKVINKEGGDTDSEEEQEKINELEEILRFYDPSFVSSNTNEEQNPKEAHQLHFGVECMRCAEVLFQPSMIGCSQGGIIDTINFTLKKFDMKISSKLVENVFLTGGPSKLRGFAQRMHRELKEMRPIGSHINVQLAESSSLDAWYGAKMFANREDFFKYLLTPQMYAEMGGDYFVEHECSNKYYPLPEAILESEFLNEQNTDI
ncbi:actin-related protein 5 [Daktulosphaira vitifoliae]|uniref:actin-related protein 5 n=1 Tax=Daktulosphaira vitifoliae TaxID=58002 RepID=UPI0021AA4844|nr:actin-related protein 5 [Daktulosphaira vitifoliae]